MHSLHLDQAVASRSEETMKIQSPESTCFLNALETVWCAIRILRGAIGAILS